ncbi:Y+L amino acid transporter [Wickerhamomyces ciferrii]|uniref:Y+L amino acid transporter n=1 Tax=Wickerhamomyces ciferrii (strain ATCC 14091 / BCRC 22168 / CBS 111 / JCM 3599 / NBRC 0793 / NRRL Y-1031 F-60-10) TaxID=1206466 RepID=K0KKH9_WICCF|nr:Y+L amino acid transporter [Wickerhamomyces ciferrii]CCH43476.1 Y+L amino acid transporter [Wickerhamomyces ciferrii]
MSSSNDLYKDQFIVEINSRSNSDASDEQLISENALDYGSTKEINDSILQVDLENLPQGRQFGVFSTIVLFISRIFGSGIWATPALVFQGVGGSPLLFFIMWIIAALMAFAGLFIYLELGSIVPKSGGTKVFLEFIYPRPFLLISVVFAIFQLVFSMSITNALVFGKYLLFALGFEPDYIETSQASSNIGMGLIIITCLVHGISVKTGLFVQNFLGALKLFLVAIMTITGIYVLITPTQLTGLPNHFHWDEVFKFQDSSIVTTSSLSSSLLNCFFTFGGWSSVHTLSSEIQNPNRTFKIAGPISLILALLNFTLINIAYLKIIPHDEIMEIGPLIGSILFEKIFGYKLGRQFITISIAISSASNVFVVIYSLVRMNQEIFREGYFPYSGFFASNSKIFKTPITCLVLTCFTNCIWLYLLPQGGDSFNYIISLEGYTGQIFLLLTSIGIFIIRYRFPHSRASIRASRIGTILIIFVTLFIIISPFFTKDSNQAKLGGLPPYYILSPLILISCVGFWGLKFKILPYLFGYELENEVKELHDGLTIKKWVKVYH